MYDLLESAVSASESADFGLENGARQEIFLVQNSINQITQ